MTDIVITWLTAALAAAVFLQPNPARMRVAAVYAAQVVGYDLLFGGTGGFGYYAGAALCDVATVMYLGHRCFKTRLTTRLQGLCLLSIAANALGWLLWVSRVSPDLYNWLFVILYLCALGLFTFGDNCYVGRRSHTGRAVGLRSIIDPRFFNISANRKEAAQ